MTLMNTNTIFVMLVHFPTKRRLFISDEKSSLSLMQISAILYVYTLRFWKTCKLYIKKYIYNMQQYGRKLEFRISILICINTHFTNMMQSPENQETTRKKIINTIINLPLANYTHFKLCNLYI
jgi:hypothetical protein